MVVGERGTLMIIVVTCHIIEFIMSLQNTDYKAYYTL